MKTRFQIEPTVPRNMTLSDREKNPELFYKFLRADFENQRIEDKRKHVRFLFEGRPALAQKQLLGIVHQ